MYGIRAQSARATSKHENGYQRYLSRPRSKRRGFYSNIRRVSPVYFLIVIASFFIISLLSSAIAWWQFGETTEQDAKWSAVTVQSEQQITKEFQVEQQIQQQIQFQDRPYLLNAEQFVCAPELCTKNWGWYNSLRQQIDQQKSTIFEEQIQVYQPEETAFSYFPQSQRYLVKVSNGAGIHQPLVYFSKAPADHSVPLATQNNTVSWTQFNFKGTVNVFVTKLDGSFRNVIVRPLKHGIDVTQISSEEVRFSLSEPAHISVEFDFHYIRHSLLIFADPLESEIPEVNNSTVLFGPGIHNIGDWEVPIHIKHIYLAQGAYVLGCMRVFERENGFQITGRGLLSGEQWAHRSKRHLLYLYQVNDTIVNGITLVNAPHFNIDGWGVNQKFELVKVLGWRKNNDGIALRENGTAVNCFIRTNDDAFRLGHSHINVDNTVIWQQKNGACFQLGWTIHWVDVISNVTVSNIDVIHTHWIGDQSQADDVNTAIVCTMNNGTGSITGYTFENVTIENSTFRLVLFKLRPPSHTFPERTKHVSNILFKNWNVHGVQTATWVKNLIAGYSSSNGSRIATVSNVTFENLQIGGKYITPQNYLDEAGFQFDPNTVTNVSFNVDQGLSHPCQSELNLLRLTAKYRASVQQYSNPDGSPLRGPTPNPAWGTSDLWYGQVDPMLIGPPVTKSAVYPGLSTACNAWMKGKGWNNRVGFANKQRRRAIE